MRAALGHLSSRKSSAVQQLQAVKALMAVSESTSTGSPAMRLLQQSCSQCIETLLSAVLGGSQVLAAISLKCLMSFYLNFEEIAEPIVQAMTPDHQRGMAELACGIAKVLTRQQKEGGDRPPSMPRTRQEDSQQRDQRGLSTTTTSAAQVCTLESFLAGELNSQHDQHDGEKHRAGNHEPPMPHASDHYYSMATVEALLVLLQASLMGACMLACGG